MSDLKGLKVQLPAAFKGSMGLRGLKSLKSLKGSGVQLPAAFNGSKGLKLQ
jgi:hypothetical protein